MITMGLPSDQRILAAIGMIAIRHGQLDYALKMAVKSLANLSIREALDGTERQGSRDLRIRVHKLARKRFGEGEPLVRLDAILNRAARATERRNELLHGLWAHELDGGPLLRSGGSKFGPPPAVAELEAIAEDLARIATDLTMARLDGFFHEALRVGPTP